ncbi:hypothetical protein BCR39DRAFT_592676 [Naematelia encephala]|uniref:ER transporter 6TM N-terminal domain-containing protein n=1 Tax=Naematelia encephala TaxID=71784 RepID=A0A1Y2BGJ8_9TREE|nr:hypothetical protein BCR39DRAFT_592676 [Naematelia encephala]
MSQDRNGDEKVVKNHDTSKTDAKRSLGHKLWTELPVWLQLSLTSRRAWKNFIRSMIATFGTLVLMLAQPSLNVLGQAAFFGLIMSQMLPPYMPVSLYAFALITLAIGLLTGWAWGCAAMAAAIRARSQVLLARETETAEAGYNHNANIDVQYQKSIFEGAFLDPASSAVFGVFLFIGAYTLGFVRASKPRLTLACVFGTIILDIMCSYGALFPFAQYTLARQLLLPASCYMAIALASIVLLFPQTMNALLTQGIADKMLTTTRSILRLQDDVLSTSTRDEARWSELAKQGHGLRAAHARATNELGGQVAMLQLEISHGQLGPGDVAKVYEKAKELGTKAFALASFVMLQNERMETIKKHTNRPGGRPMEHAKMAFRTMEKHRHPGTAMDELLPILADCTSDLRAAANAAFDKILTWLHEMNHTRWGGSPSGTIEERTQSLETLRSALREFRETKHFLLLDPYRFAFDESGQIRTTHVKAMRFSARDLFRCYVLTSSLISFSTVLVEFCQLLLDFEQATPKAKFQLPTKFAQMLIHSANEKSAGGNPLDMGAKDLNEHANVNEDTRPEESSETLVEKKERRIRTYAKDPDAGDPRNGVQKFGRSLHAVWHTLSSPNGIFALKYGLVSVALWIPQVCHSSAYFVYSNRGLWALIMAQTGLGVFTGEQISTFFLRMAGTCAGLVVGMVTWYVGSGHGPGNPYGVAASTMFFIAPFLYLRIAAPPPAMVFFLMTGVTITFTVGYSWVDEHVYQTANQGSGAALAGRRALLVIIGFTAGFIVMLFPKPTSARQIVRLNLSRCIADTSDLYGRVLTGIEEEAEDVEDGILEVSQGKGLKEERKDVKERQDRYRKQFLRIIGRMQVLQQQMGFASAEPGLKGPWPKAAYQEVYAVLEHVVSSLALLSGAYARLEPQWAKNLAERSDMMHPAFIADCLALFSIVHQSLRTGKPLPPTIPIFERLAYHQTRHPMFRLQARGPTTATTTIPAEDNDDENDGVTTGSDVDRLSIMEDDKAIENLGRPLTWDIAHDEQLSVFATANVALVHIVVGLDRLQRAVVELVGETVLGDGFDRAVARWGKREVDDV